MNPFYIVRFGFVPHMQELTTAIAEGEITNFFLNVIVPYVMRFHKVAIHFKSGVATTSSQQPKPGKETIVSWLEEKLEADVKNAPKEQVQSFSSLTGSHRPVKVHQRQILPLVVLTIRAEKVPVLRTIMHTSC